MAWTAVPRSRRMVEPPASAARSQTLSSVRLSPFEVATRARRSARWARPRATMRLDQPISPLPSSRALATVVARV